MAMNNSICKKCALDAKTHGITINPATGLCQFCENYTPVSSQKKEEYATQINMLLSSPPKEGEYDVLMALSGGVDSSYALYRLKQEYPDLRVLAVQFDNGFI